MTRELTDTAVRKGGDEIGTGNELLAELDFRIAHILGALGGDDVLSSQLYVKGGTAISKLYLEGLSRLSVDIDLNRIGSRERVFAERDELVDRLVQAIRAQDGSYRFRFKKRYEQTTLRVDFRSLAGPPQRIKVEVSHIERFPILPATTRPLSLPDGDEVPVPTYRPEELVATKIRALHDRLKGRDIYDVWGISTLIPLDLVPIRKMVLYSFYRGRKVFNPKLFFRRLDGAIEERGIDDDVSGFARPDVLFDLPETARDTSRWLRFLADFDQADETFVMLVRTLLRKEQVPRSKQEEIASIERPLDVLFGERYGITEAARLATVEDIRLFEGGG